MVAYVVCGQNIGASPELYLQQVRKLCEEGSPHERESLLTSVADKIAQSYHEEVKEFHPRRPSENEVPSSSELREVDPTFSEAEGSGPETNQETKMECSSPSRDPEMVLLNDAERTP